MVKPSTMNSFINAFFSIFFTLIFSVTAYSAQDEQNSFETDLYLLKMPKYMRQLNPPAGVIGDPNNNSFAFVYGETDEKSKKIFIIINGQKNINITKGERSSVLRTMTVALRDNLFKKCNAQKISDFTSAIIDNSDAIYFEILNTDCRPVRFKCWCLIKGKYFITINLFGPEPAEGILWRETEEALKKMKFKINDGSRNQIHDHLNNITSN